jgi:tRNA pseudouridine32 synthase/23S rRNA pseudouridine746 synthase
LGRPIVGDELYGTREKDQHLMLHAAEIWFRHPVTNEEMHFSLAPDFLP